jgi:lysozyme
MPLNSAAVELIKEFEGFVNHWYPDPVSGGKPWTCCYGHTEAAGPPKFARGQTFTKAEGEAILQRDLARFAATVEQAIKVKVTGNQFGACVSLAYNIGEPAFLRSTLLKKLNAADYSGAAQEFSRWNKVGAKVIAGLSRRRAAEKALFQASEAKSPASETKSPPSEAKTEGKTVGDVLAAIIQFILALFGRR